MKYLIPIGAGLAVLIAAAQAGAQTCAPDLKGARRAESGDYTVAYRTNPSPVVMSKHFSVELAVCGKGAAPAPTGIGVDATMPEHRHGMNYKPVVKPTGDGRYVAEGLMFHMPGRWEFAFDVQAGGKTYKVTDSLLLK